MALTELQRPKKTAFYRCLQDAANEMNAVINKWRDLSEFIGFVTVEDLDEMGVPEGQLRTDLNNFRTMIQEILSLYDGGTVTPTTIPNDVLDKIRSMNGN